MRKTAPRILILCLLTLGAWPTPSKAAPWRIGMPSPSVSYFPAIVAAKMGFFAEEGVPAEFVMMKPSIAPAALVNGEIQFTTATGTAATATSAPAATSTLGQRRRNESECQDEHQEPSAYSGCHRLSPEILHRCLKPVNIDQL